VAHWDPVGPSTPRNSLRSLDAATSSLDWVREFELMKSVQVVKVAFDDAAAEIPAIQIHDRCNEQQ